MGAPKYTAEQIEFIRALWDEGSSSATISTRINAQYGLATTRRAIIGLAHREGFDKRGPSGVWLEEGARKRVATMVAKAIPFGRTPKKIAPKPITLSEEPAPIGLIGEFEPGMRTCRWPHDVPTGLQWCGHLGFPWCAFHASKAYSAAHKPMLSPSRSDRQFR